MVVFYSQIMKHWLKNMWLFTNRITCFMIENINSLIIKIEIFSKYEYNVKPDVTSLWCVRVIKGPTKHCVHPTKNYD